MFSINNKRLQSILRIILGSILIFSGLVKIIDLTSFGRIVNSFNFLSQSGVIIVTFLVPYIELVLGLMLILNYQTKAAALITMLLIFIFTVISAQKYFSGIISDCGCFGKIIERKTDLKLLIENAFLIILTIFIYFNIKEAKNEKE